MHSFLLKLLGLQPDNVSKLSKSDAINDGDLNLLFFDTGTVMTVVYNYLHFVMPSFFTNSTSNF